MKKSVVLFLSLVSISASAGQSRFFRIGCLEVGLPDNLAITCDELGQIFLEFDTVAQRAYIIQAADCLVPSAWTTVWSVTGDGRRVRWLTTRRWSRTFGTSGYDYAYSVQQTSDGGYIVAGATGSFGAGGLDVYLIKTDQNGIEVWSRTFGGGAADSASSVQQTPDGGYIAAGATGSFGAGGLDVYLVKADQNGKEVWSRTFGAGDGEGAESLQQTSDGGYIMAGVTGSFGAGWSDACLVKADENGHEAWSRTFGRSDYDWALSVQQTSDGGYIVAGYTLSFGAGGSDAYLIKMDQNGDEVWSRTFGGGDSALAHSVQQTSDGGYIVAGQTLSFSAGEGDVYLIKTDQNGSEVWSRTFGGSANDEACSVEQTSDGGYVIAGYTYSFGAGNGDVYLIKTDQNGNAPPPQ